MTITLIHIVHDHLSGRQDIDKTTEALLALSLPPARFEADVRATILYKLCEGDDEHLTGMQKLLHMILASAKAGICSREFCFQLLEEACDTQTIKGCDVLFRFLEKNRKSMTEGMGKGITLLRLCNELLRRLSKTEDTVFCGRILIFLSLAFPLAERSAVNLRGEYNVENVTSYEEDANMDENDANDEATTVHGVHVNDLYTNFWSLQSYFSNPPELLNNESTLQSFRNSLSTVLAALKTIEDSTRIHDLANDDKDTRKLAAKLANHEVQKYFTPKFLTSKKLLNLELADLSFRRHILVQIMIAMDFLQLYSTEGREKWASENINKSMSSNYVLSSADLAWVLEIRKLATSILRAGRYGKTFLDTTEKILRQDRAWLLWKCNNCPAYDIPPVDQARLDNVPKKIALLTATKRAYPYPVGNAVLTNLWADAGGWSERELNDVKKLPSIQSYAGRIDELTVELSDAMQEEEVQVIKDKQASNAWRGLRIARKDDIRSFTDKVAGGNLAEYLRAKDTSRQSTGSNAHEQRHSADADDEHISSKRSVSALESEDSATEVTRDKRVKV